MGSTDAHGVHLMELARRNDDFRRVATTGDHLQVVLMTLQPGEEIGEETHPDIDQMLLFVEGEGTAVLGGLSGPVTAGEMVFVPADTSHNFINTGAGPWRLITTYAPPEHEPGTVHPTKTDADAAEEHHH